MIVSNVHEKIKIWKLKTEPTCFSGLLCVLWENSVITLFTYEPEVSALPTGLYIDRAVNSNTSLQCN